MPYQDVDRFVVFQNLAKLRVVGLQVGLVPPLLLRPVRDDVAVSVPEGHGMDLVPTLLLLAGACQLPDSRDGVVVRVAAPRVVLPHGIVLLVGAQSAQGKLAVAAEFELAV